MQKVVAIKCRFAIISTSAGNNAKQEEREMNALTITANMNDGEVAVFKVKPLVSINEVMDAVEWIVSPQCVVELAEDGVWEIV